MLARKMHGAKALKGTNEVRSLVARRTHATSPSALYDHKVGSAAVLLRRHSVKWEERGSPRAPMALGPSIKHQANRATSPSSREVCQGCLQQKAQRGLRRHHCQEHTVTNVIRLAALMPPTLYMMLVARSHQGPWSRIILHPLRQGLSALVALVPQVS